MLLAAGLCFFGYECTKASRTQLLFPLPNGCMCECSAAGRASCVGKGRWVELVWMWAWPRGELISAAGSFPGRVVGAGERKAQVG